MPLVSSRLLILETTCDETAAAVVDSDCRVCGSALASQDALHLRFGGVVPEIASRAHVERIVPVIDQALARAGSTLADMAGIAVANTPGLAGSLLVGLAAAKAIALACDIPLVAVNHVHAHIYACRVAHGPDVFPCVGLVVSGGHTTLYRCESPLVFEWLGGTIDDAAGEAFDKVAAMLGLGYPGGPAIQRAATNGNPRAYRFPRSLIDRDSQLDFSFSGLKTAVRYAIAGSHGGAIDHEKLTSGQSADLAASFQEAVVDVLATRSRQTILQTGLSTLCVGGGVAANERLRRRLMEMAASDGFRLYLAPTELCTDNAVMGAIAWERLRAGMVESLDLDVYPGLMRQQAGGGRL